jgi:hypothetical protein
MLTYRLQFEIVVFGGWFVVEGGADPGVEDAQVLPPGLGVG